MQTQKFEGLMLDPAVIVAEGNSRYGLKPERITKLAASIVEMGGVMEPVEVEDIGGGQYRLISGFYRHAATSELNQSGAGILLPAQVKEVADAKERLKRQLAENMERENQSPMDKAEAIKTAFDVGFSRQEIMKMFMVIGGRKGNTPTPASNSYLNLHLKFLEFPKNIRDRIHDGRIGVAGAVRLLNYDKSEWKGIVDQMEEDRLKAIEKEEREEAKILAAAEKETKTHAKETEAKTELETAEAARVKAEELEQKTTEDAAKAYLKANGKGFKDDAEKKAAKDALKDAETARDAAIKAADAVRKSLGKAREKLDKAATAAKERADKLLAARKKVEADLKAAKAGKGADKPMGAPEVAKAAAAKGAAPTKGDGVVKLNATDMRKVVDELALPGSYPKCQAIGLAFKACFDSLSTPNQLYAKLAEITGEKAAKKTK